MLGSEEEQQELRRAMEKVGWFADSDSDLQYGLTKDYVLSRQDAPARSAMRILNKAHLGEQGMARISSPRVDYDTPIAAKASDLESLLQDISNAHEVLVAHKILQQHEEWHEEYARQLVEVKGTVAERQDDAAHGS
eukprot:jgi/Tetstr1/432408/TSEL_021804.t1